MGALLLVALSVLAWVAAVALAARGYGERRGELALATGVLWLGLILVPIHVLGWTGLLYRTSVAIAAAVLSAAALTVSLALGPAGRRGPWLAHAAGRALSIVPRAFRDAWRERSLTLVGLTGAVVVWLWTAWLAYLARANAWDGLYYHEPMVTLALQNHGFRAGSFRGPPALQLTIDGYPRMVENLMLWLVAFWDRRLIDFAPTITAPLLVLATYLLARRFVASRTVAVGLACALFLVPGIALEMRSTLVDTSFLALVAASLYFVTRPRLRRRDLWMAGLCLGLMVGSKVTGAILGPLLGAIGLGRVVVGAVRRRDRWMLVHAFLATVLVLSLGAPTFARNWVRHGNLFWPSSLHVSALGVDWKGPVDLSDMSRPVGRVVSDLFSPPVPNEQNHDSKDNGYGNGPPFVVLPLAVFALLASGWKVISGLARGPRGPHWWQAAHLWWVAVPVFATLALSPAKWWARLNLHVLLAVFLLAAWAIGRPSRRHLAEGVVGVLVVTGLMTLWWSEPAWFVSWDRAWRLAGMTAQERALDTGGLGHLMPTRTARVRERDLGPGDLVVFTEYGFTALLWNEDLTNRVEQWKVRGSPQRWFERVDRSEAKWVVVRPREPVARLLQRSPHWQRVGDVCRILPGVAYRRTGGQPM